MTILKSPFKSLPTINDSKNGMIRANSEEPTAKADKDIPPVVCVTLYSCDMSARVFPASSHKAIRCLIRYIDLIYNTSLSAFVV